MAKHIYIHAGGHRTGSSSFQLCLAENRAVLNARGYDLFYPGRDGAPGGQPQFHLPEGGDGPKRREIIVQRVSHRLNAISPDPERSLILSEENLSGRIYPCLRGRFFPIARRRASAMRAALGQAPTHVVMVVRPYASFLQSCYRLRAQDNQVRPFAALAPDMVAAPRGWLDAVRDLFAGLEPDLMTVVEIGARKESRSLLQRLVPDLADVELCEPQRRVNLSATDAALTEIQRRFREGADLSDADVSAVVSDYAEDQTDCSFARFTESQATALAERYERDLESIAAMKGVNLLR
ncbi:MAG: hypothetical protein AB3N23_05460 [Paracoccaceae bacterium]